MSPDRLHSEPVCEQRMMCDQQRLAEWQFVAWRVDAGVVAEADETLRLVQRNPVRNAVRKFFHHDASVVSEPVRAVAVQPATLAIERQRIVPVKKREPWLDARREQGIDEAVAEGEAGRTYPAAASPQHTRPPARNTGYQ